MYHAIMGRPPIPSKLTPELQATMCECFRLGMPIEYACKAVGIASVTYRRWLRAGKKYDDKIYVDFVAAIKKSQADFVEDNMKCIRRAADGKSWQAAAWLLERRLNEHFGLKEIAAISDLQIEIGGIKALLKERKAT